MKIRSLALAVAAISVVASPAIAQAGFARANAPIEEENEAAGGTGIVIAVLAGAAVVGGIALASSNNSDDNPTSS